MATTIMPHVGKANMAVRFNEPPRVKKEKRSKSPIYSKTFSVEDNTFSISFRYNAKPGQPHSRITLKRPTDSAFNSSCHRLRLTDSLPNLRRLLELQRQYTNVSNASNEMKPTRPPPSPPQPAYERSSSFHATSNNEAGSRALLKSRQMSRRSLRNNCNWEEQEEQRTAGIMKESRKKTQTITQMLRDHLKAENRPNQGLIYDMIFAKRMDKSRMVVKDQKTGVVNALAGLAVEKKDKHVSAKSNKSDKSDNCYRCYEQQLAPGGTTVTVEKRSNEPFITSNYETPTRTAMSIARQLDSNRKVTVGINGRLTSAFSSGWSDSDVDSLEDSDERKDTTSSEAVKPEQKTNTRQT